jgi:hypothetical protein
MTQPSLALEFGIVPEKRPATTAVKAQRHWLRFDSKESALRWSSRNRPLVIPARAAPISAHPRAVKTDSGDFCLAYHTCDIRCPRWTLNSKLELVPMR